MNRLPGPHGDPAPVLAIQVRFGAAQLRGGTCHQRANRRHIRSVQRRNQTCVRPELIVDHALAVNHHPVPAVDHALETRRIQSGQREERRRPIELLNRGLNEVPDIGCACGHRLALDVRAHQAAHPTISQSALQLEQRGARNR